MSQLAECLHGGAACDTLRVPFEMSGKFFEAKKTVAHRNSCANKKKVNNKKNQISDEFICLLLQFYLGTFAS